MRRVLVFLGFAFATSSVACQATDKPPAGADGGAGDGDPPPVTPDASDGASANEATGCTTASDCVHPASDPAGCVVVECVDRLCRYHTQDADGDGHYAQDSCRVTDGSVTLISGDDCADDDPDVHPGAWDGPAGVGPDGETEPDACNLKDDNCDGLGDNLHADSASCKCVEGTRQSCWADRDGTPIPYPANQLDGIGTCQRGFQLCEQGGWSPCFGATGPQKEVCDGMDNDCDGAIDEDASDAQPYYCDHDRDEQLAPGTKPEVTCPNNLADCEGGVWRSLESTKNLFGDCDDHDPNRWTGNLEVCDGVDNDCDPENLVDQIRSDDGGLVDLRVTYYRDADDDNFGDPEKTKQVCPQDHDGYVDNAGDCDDSAESVNRRASELCNGIDDDCDGKLDADDPKLSGQPVIAGTEFACVGGRWIIVACPDSNLDCNKDPLDGCEASATKRDNCHACGTQCAFSCGSTGCDDFASISAGGSHTCAVTEGGVAACWGSNEFGQLGDENVSVVRFEPVLVGGLPSVVHSIFTGPSNTCAIAGDDQALYCWGDNHHNQVGSLETIHTTVSSPEPVTNIPDPEQANLVGVAWVALGNTHACAIHDGGHLACWGDNSSSQIFDEPDFGDTFQSAQSITRTIDGDPIDDVAGIAAGSHHTCLLNRRKTVECWGANADGQAGVDTAGASVPWPRLVAGLTAVDQIAAGNSFTCALAAGDVYCWGNNDFGQLGRAGMSSPVPGKVFGLPRARSIALGGYYACALPDEAGGKPLCWGKNPATPVGPAPAFGTQSTPYTVDLADVSFVTTGYAHTCAVSANGRGYCWGSNDSGQLGAGRIGASVSPSPLAIDPLK